MSVLGLATLVPLLLLARIHCDPADNCSQCASTNYGCQLCYSNCSSTIFRSCSNENRVMNEATCMEECCADTGGRYSFDNQTLANCLKKKEQSGKEWMRSAGYYAILGAGSLAILILIIIAARAIYLQAKLRRMRVARRVIPESSFISHNGNGLSDPNRASASLQELDSKVFPANCKDIMQDPTNSCCICLDSSVNAITKCGHVFHLKCLSEWCHRRNSCPLCNYKHINEAKFYCSKCKSQTSTVDLHWAKPADIERLEKGRCGVCG